MRRRRIWFGHEPLAISPKQGSSVYPTLLFRTLFMAVCVALSEVPLLPPPEPDEGDRPGPKSVASRAERRGNGPQPAILRTLAPSPPRTGGPPGAGLPPAPRTGACAVRAAGRFAGPFSDGPGGGQTPGRLRLFRHDWSRAGVRRRAVLRSLSSEDRRVLPREGNGPGFPPAGSEDGDRGLHRATVRPHPFGTDLPDVPPG